MDANQSKISAALQNLALISATLTPLLYINGKSFYDGYLHGWRIPGDLFPISFEETLVNGIYAYSFLIAKPISYLFLTSIVIFECIILFDALSDTKTFKNITKKLSTNKKENDDSKSIKNNRKIDTVVTISKYFIAFSFVSIFIFLFFIILQSKSYQKGNEWATDQKTKILTDLKSDNKNVYPKIILENKSKITDNFYGYIIKSSPTNYAILTAKEIYIIPTNQINHMKIQNK